MADNSAPTTRGLSPGVRRALLVAALVVAAWAATRVVLLLSGADGVVSDNDPHGYTAIFSLLLTPLLVLAVALLATNLRRGGPLRIAPGVALTLSAPLASPVALVAVALGVAIIVAAVVDQRAQAATR